MLTIAGVAAAGAILNAIYPTLSRSSGAVITASAKVDDRLKSDIEIVHAVGELDSGGSFSDTNANGSVFDSDRVPPQAARRAGRARTLALAAVVSHAGAVFARRRLPIQRRDRPLGDS